MKTPTRQRHAASLLAGVVALVLVGTVGPAGAQTVDPIAFDVTPPTQTTTPGTQVDITFTVSDVPPCAEEEITTLDSLDFTLTEPSGLATIDSFTVSEPPGTYDPVFSPDMRTLTILFDSAFPCLNGTTETITVVVTIDVPGGVPSGAQLTIEGDARGFAGGDYVLTRTGLVLVEEAPPPPPPSTTDPGGGEPPDGGAGSGGGAGSAGETAGSAVAATSVSATPRFTG